ncbi:hypothetical protein BgiBS90_037892 [Biomphalaria glabrata]|nr:hypothetical protein BgiBS90_037892 [Biomphalaria glabrata]
MEFNQQAQPYASRRTSVSANSVKHNVKSRRHNERLLLRIKTQCLSTMIQNQIIELEQDDYGYSNYNSQLSMDQNNATKRVFAPVQFTSQSQQHCLNPYQSNLNLQTSLSRPATNPMDLPANSQPSFKSHQRSDQAMHQFHGNQITHGRSQRTHNDQMNNLPQVNSGERLMIKYNHRTPESSQSSWKHFQHKRILINPIKILMFPPLNSVSRSLHKLQEGHNVKQKMRIDISYTASDKSGTTASVKPGPTGSVKSGITASVKSGPTPALSLGSKPALSLGSQPALSLS